MSLAEFLSDWVVNYVKSKDIFKKTIRDIKRENSEIVVFHKHKEETFFIDPFLEQINKKIKEIKKDSHAFFVCINTEENFKKLIELWRELIDYNHLGIIFINPFSKTDRLWTIFPYTHSRIADESTLEIGLRTMFEQVETANREEIEKVYKNS